MSPSFRFPPLKKNLEPYLFQEINWTTLVASNWCVLLYWRLERTGFRYSPVCSVFNFLLHQPQQGRHSFGADAIHWDDDNYYQIRQTEFRKGYITAVTSFSFSPFLLSQDLARDSGKTGSGRGGAMFDRRSRYSSEYNRKKKLPLRKFLRFLGESV